MREITAFTLLELVVVMGIVSIMAALGIQGLIIFQQTVQFQQAETDIVTVLNDVRNRARNSVASNELADSTSLPNAVVDAYALGFAANNYSLRRCSITASFGNKQASCINVEFPDMKPEVLTAVNIFPTDPGKCRAILFERLNANIAALPALVANLDEVGTCTIRIQHSNNPSLVREIVIDLGNNSSDVF